MKFLTLFPALFFCLAVAIASWPCPHPMPTRAFSGRASVSHASSFHEKCSLGPHLAPAFACPDNISRLRWINFSPYTLFGQDPRKGDTITDAQIIMLLDSLQPYAEGIRTFGTRYGLQNIPRLARLKGFKVIVGIWLDYENTPVGLAANTSQIANGIAIAKAGDADRVIVGSEVLYRHNFSPAKLVQYINQVKAVCKPLGIPVSCADVYYELAAYPQVIAACDFVAPNIYPFFEGMHIDEAMVRFHHAYQIVLAAAGGKPIFISESGWKTSGPKVGAAEPSFENALRYDHALLHWSKSTGVEVCIFCAFDEPWKLPNDDGWGIFFNNATLKPGMKCLFAPITQVDTTWLCEKLNGNGLDTLVLDFVPIIGSNDLVRGHVNFVKPCDYMVALYIKVPNWGWVMKPTSEHPFVPINSDGTWSAPYLTGGNDGLATEICAFLIPVNYWPPTCLACLALSPAIYQNAIASVCYQRYVLSPVSVTVESDTICRGDTISLTAAGGVYYLWEKGETTATIKVAPQYTTTYRVTITDGMGGGAIASASIRVVSPNLSASASPSSICPGDSSILTAKGGASYVWNTGQTGESIMVFPEKTSLYTVTATDARGCTGTAGAYVTVKNFSIYIPPPGASSLCVGKTVTLYTNIGGAVSYLWNTGQATSSIQIPMLDTLPHIYAVTVTNTSSGCTSSASINLKANTVPAVTLIAIPNKICNGDSTTLKATDNAHWKHYWGTNGDTSASIRVAPSSTRTYRVTVTNTASCSATASAVVTVDARPSVSISASPSLVCAGKKSTLTATGAGTSGTYLWNTGQNTSSISVFPTETTTYAVTVTNAAGCATAASATVAVSIPTVAVSASQGSICSGSTVVLTASGDGTYLWSGGQKTDSIQMSPTETATYTVTLTNALGCTATASAMVSVFPQPTVFLGGLDSIYTNQSPAVTLLSNFANCTFNGPGVGGNQFFPGVAGLGKHTIFCMVIDTNGCGGVDSVSVEVQPFVSSTTWPQGIRSVQISPQPSRGKFWLQIEATESKRLEIRLIGADAKVLNTCFAQTALGKNSLFFETSNLPTGLYILMMKTDDGEVWSERIVINL